jgi:DNA polymerase-3 subunit epsilon
MNKQEESNMNTTKSPKQPRLSLTKSQLQTAAGAELLNLCQSLTEDGHLMDEEVTALKTWLEENRNTDLPSSDFLTTAVKQIIADGVVTKEERLLLYKAIEIVLPPEVRKEAVDRRKEAESKDKILSGLEREAQKQKEREESERNHPLSSANFMVAGIHYEGRPETIRRYARPEEQVYLARDRNNKYSKNAIEVRLKNSRQIGFVPEDDAVDLAPCMDGECKHYAYITKILTGGHSPIPVVQAYIYRPNASVEGAVSESEIPGEKLYSIGDEIRNLSLPPQKVALHRNPKDRNEVIIWARNLMERKDWLILDTETTGLGPSDEIIQIGIIDPFGNVVFNSLLNPVKRRMSQEAKAKHGIELSSLRNAPTFVDIYPKLRELLHGKLVVAYNIQYENRILTQTCAKHASDDSTLGRIRLTIQCAMTAYSAFIGEWNPKYQDYKWQKLPGTTHDAIEDCLATLKVIKEMANAELSVIPDPWWRCLFKWFARKK